MPGGKQKKSALKISPLPPDGDEVLELETKSPEKKVPEKKDVFQEKPLEKIAKSAPEKSAETVSLWKKIKKSISEFGGVPSSEKVFFAENFRVMVKAGLSISEALETLALQTRSKKFSAVLYDIRSGVVSGNTLASALAKYPKIFPEYFVNMIKVGEMSGNLENNLEELANQMKKDHELTSKVRGAMIYPAVIVVATIGIGIVMFVYVIPSMLSIFEEMNLQLPLATRILIAISNTINKHGLLLALAAIAAITGIVMLGRTKQGQKTIHLVLLNLWIVGPIIKKINLARFSRTISALLKTDIPVIEAFKIASTVLGNIYYKEACLRASEELSQGTTINSSLLKTPKLFPPLVTQMILVGEKSGTLDTLLSELANFYESEVEDITKNLSSIIEPILIVFLGGVVGLIAFAVISPIYSLSQGI
ncbi:MAG: type II secretion system F family protein [bacterium]